MKVLHYDVPIGEANEVESKVIELMIGRAADMNGTLCLSRYDSNTYATSLFVLSDSKRPPSTMDAGRRQRNYRLIWTKKFDRVKEAGK